MTRKQFKKLFRDHYRKAGVPYRLGWWAYRRNRQLQPQLWLWMET